MNNLTIENLSKIVNAGDAEGLMGMRRIEGPSIEGGGIDGAAGGGSSFTNILQNALDKVNTDQLQADRAVKELAAGKTKNIHETMLTLERADVSLKLAMQVRNKILEAYKEIIRMQV